MNRKNYRQRINRGLFAFFVFTFLQLNASAVNYYIAPSGSGGSDANNGTTAGTPKLTLQSVFNTYNLGAGDVIYVTAGTYTEKTIAVGSDDEGFTIQGAALSNGEPTTIFSSTQNGNGWLTLNNNNSDNIYYKLYT